MPEWLFIVALVAAYLVGGLPFGWLLVRALRGVDLREVGSGNIGATNAGRVLGKRGAIFVFLLDMGKGLVAVTGFGRVAVESAALQPWVPLVCGFVAILGHCFTPYLAFRGGKGVATTVGVLLGLEPIAFACAGLLWIVALELWKMVSLASLILGVAFPVALLVRHGGAVFAEQMPLMVTALVVMLLIFVRHRANIRRILDGTEPKVGRKSNEDGDEEKNS